eukprot:gene2406-1509_t
MPKPTPQRKLTKCQNMNYKPPASLSMPYPRNLQASRSAAFTPNARSATNTLAPDRSQRHNQAQIHRNQTPQHAAKLTSQRKLATSSHTTALHPRNPRITTQQHHHLPITTHKNAQNLKTNKLTETVIPCHPKSKQQTHVLQPSPQSYSQIMQLMQTDTKHLNHPTGNFYQNIQNRSHKPQLQTPTCIKINKSPTPQQKPGKIPKSRTISPPHALQPLRHPKTHKTPLTTRVTPNPRISTISRLSQLASLVKQTPKTRSKLKSKMPYQNKALIQT